MDYKHIFTLLLVTVTLANCKPDWTDTYYSSILRDDLVNILGDDSIKTNYRVTRDAKEEPLNKTVCNNASNRQSSSSSPSSSSTGLNRYQRSCCGESKDDLKTFGESLKNLKKECFGEIKSRKAKAEVPDDLDDCNVEKIAKDDVICVMECVNQKKQLIDDKGNIIADKMRAFVKSEMITQDWQKEVIDSIMDKCFKANEGTEKSKKGKKNHQSNENTSATPASETETTNSPAADTPVKCNKASFKFSQCLWKGLQLSCPKDMIRKTRACERLRERLDNQETGKKTKGSKKGKRKNGKRNKNREQASASSSTEGTPAALS